MEKFLFLMFLASIAIFNFFIGKNLFLFFQFLYLVIYCYCFKKLIDNTNDKDTINQILITVIISIIALIVGDLCFYFGSFNLRSFEIFR